MLVNESARYVGPEGETGTIGTKENRQPDAVIDAMVMASARYMPGLASGAPQPGLNGLPSLHDPLISEDQGKEMTIAALAAVSPARGAHAGSILNSDRFNSETVEPGQFPRIMQVRAAHLHEAGDLAIPDELRSEKFNSDINMGPQAIIDFQHDQTVMSVIMMGHEAGHAMADDIQNIAGRTHADNPTQMGEVQAYTVQHLVSDQLVQSDDPTVADTARQLVEADYRRNLVELNVGQLARQAIQGLQAGKEPNAVAMFSERFGDDWQNIRDHSPAAGQLFNAIDEPNSAVLEGLSQRVHSRATQFFVGRQIANQLSEGNGPAQRQLYDAVMGAGDGQSLPHVLAAAGASDQASLDGFADQAMAKVGDTLGIEPQEKLSIKSTSEWRLIKASAMTAGPSGLERETGPTKPAIDGS